MIDWSRRTAGGSAVPSDATARLGKTVIVIKFFCSPDSPQTEESQAASQLPQLQIWLATVIGLVPRHFSPPREIQGDTSGELTLPEGKNQA